MGYILDEETANGNPAEVNKVETAKDDGNKSEKSLKNTSNKNKKANKMASSEVNMNKGESYENGKDETDKVSKEEEISLSKDGEKLVEADKPTAPPAAPTSPVFVPKYKYSEGLYLESYLKFIK